MSWQSYIDNLMQGGFVMDAVIVGCQPGQESVWAAHPGGRLSGITANEIKQLVAKDRSSFFSNGVMLSNMKCTMLRDKLNEEGDHTIDLRTKATDSESETYNICVAKSNQALIIVVGVKDVHGGKLNMKAHGIADYLRKSGY